jgi:hypothetical protein
MTLMKKFQSKQQVFPDLPHYFPTHYLYSSDLVILGFGQFQSDNVRLHFLGCNIALSQPQTHCQRRLSGLMKYSCPYRGIVAFAGK